MITRSIVMVLCLLLTTTVSAIDNSSNNPFSHWVVKIPIVEDISIDEAIESFLVLNVKKVGHQPLYKEYKALGLPNIKRTEIFQFCDPSLSKPLIEYNISYIAFMPCRIAMIVDQQGKAWFVMMNLDQFIQLADLPKDLHERAKKFRDKMMEIIEAGANGDL